MKITKVHGREILDSRGNPTVEVDITLDGGAFGRAAVPSGASTGEREALELRDGDKARYLGKGVLKAVSHINGELAAAVVGRDHASALARRTDDRARRHADQEPPRRERPARCVDGLCQGGGGGGGPAALRAPRVVERPMGRREPHAARADDEHLERRRARGLERGRAGVHGDATGVGSFADALRAGAETFHALRSILKGRGLSTGVGDEGGFAPSLKANREAIDLVLEAINKTGLKAGTDVFIALDVAASELWKDGTYVFKKSGEPSRTPAQMVEMYEDWVRQYPIVSIEDGLGEGDWEGWAQLTTTLGDQVQIVGDDLFVTNPEILRRGIDEGVANAVLVKLNQIGTVSETLDCIAMAQEADYATIISHRSGETEDATIADLAVATGAGQIKTALPAAATARPSTTSCSESRKPSATSGTFAGKKAIRRLRQTV